MPTSWPAIFLRHYQNYLGKPFDVQTYHGEPGLTLRLATFDQRYPNFRVYASAGMSLFAEQLKGVGEILAVGDQAVKDVPFLLVNYLFFILQNNIPLTGPFTIGGIDRLRPDFVETYDKTALYFTQADGFGTGFEKIETPSETGRVFQGIFISWAEQDFINRKGPAAFEEKFRALEGELCALNRPSCV